MNLLKNILTSFVVWIFAITQTAHAATWNIPALQPAETATITITVQVNSGTSGTTITNIATNTQDQTDLNITPDDAIEELIVVNDEIEVTKQLINVDGTANMDEYYADFRFVVTNVGDRDLINVNLIDDFAGQNPSTITSILSSSGSITPSNPSVFTATSYNTSFIATPTANAFSGGTTTLESGDSVTVDSRILFRLDLANASSTPIENLADSNGEAPDSDIIEDQSDDDLSTDNVNEPLLIPIDPSGVLYDSTTGAPLAGGIATITDASGTPLPVACLTQGYNTMTTGADGFYRFDIVPNADPACPSSETEYRFVFTPPAGYSAPSTIFPGISGSYDATGCPTPASTFGSRCGIGGVFSPSIIGPTADRDHFTSFMIASGDPDVIYNHIPMDPANSGLLNVTKRVNKNIASVGDILTYTIDIENISGATVGAFNLIDTLPAGLTYVTGTSGVSVAGAPSANIEPTASGNQLSWPQSAMVSGQVNSITFLSRIGSNYQIGTMTNIAGAFNGAGDALSNEGLASTEITADPTFDCSTIVGKVFEDTNKDGYPNDGERGIPKARLLTLKGLNVTTDSEGRYHIECASIPEEARGSNFAIKLDTASVPENMFVTSENPRVVRLTKGKNSKANFAVAKGKDIRIDINDSAFDICSENVSQETLDGIKYLSGIIEDKNHKVTYVYHTDVAGRELANQRMDKLIKLTTEEFERTNPTAKFDLNIDKEIIYNGTSGSKDAICSPEEKQFIIYFNHDESSLDNSDINTLNSAVNYANDNNKRILLLSGHTDSSGSDSYNLELSRNRVNNAANQITIMGTQADIKTSYHGEALPDIFTNNGIRERLNRRVEILVK